jgi:hypothetical protein
VDRFRAIDGLFGAGHIGQSGNTGMLVSGQPETDDGRVLTASEPI